MDVGTKVRIRESAIPLRFRGKIGMILIVEEPDPKYLVVFEDIDGADREWFFRRELEELPWTLEPEPEPERGSYHLERIKKGVLGKSSKIREELEELEDAEKQGINIMVLCELSDLYGALEFYLEENFPEFTMADIANMAAATRRAFNDRLRETS